MAQNQAHDMLKNGLIDGIIKEPIDGAHRDVDSLLHHRFVDCLPNSCQVSFPSSYGL